jgi:hypothetical protein
MNEEYPSLPQEEQEEILTPLFYMTSVIETEANRWIQERFKEMEQAQGEIHD